MAKRFCKPAHGEVDEAGISKLVEAGELKQFCVELTRVEDTKVSVDFARNILGRSGDFIESKNERNRTRD